MVIFCPDIKGIQGFLRIQGVPPYCIQGFLRIQGVPPWQLIYGHNARAGRPGYAGYITKITKI